MSNHLQVWPLVSEWLFLPPSTCSIDSRYRWHSSQWVAHLDTHGFEFRASVRAVTSQILHGNGIGTEIWVRGHRNRRVARKVAFQQNHCIQSNERRKSVGFVWSDILLNNVCSMVINALSLWPTSTLSDWETFHRYDRHAAMRQWFEIQWSYSLPFSLVLQHYGETESPRFV